MTEVVSSPVKSKPPGDHTGFNWKLLLKWMAGTFVVVLILVFGVLLYVQRLVRGAEANPLHAVSDAGDVLSGLSDPRAAFPGQREIVILGLGLDRNWTRRNQMYTKNARTDTLMVIRLDLETRRVAVLSIPRDTWVKLAGRRGHGKINSAHALGGVETAKQTVEELLGIHIDHYIVIKQEAIEKAVDGIGGLSLNVEKDMDYDDNWGHLHIHLKQGLQHLNGSEVVGYMRFRHDPEGDFGRMRRQQQVVRAVARELRKSSTIRHVPGLMKVINEYIKTDLEPKQRIALARLFHNVKLDDVLTATLPCDSGVVNGISYVFPFKEDMEALTDWLLRGLDDAANPLITVTVRNGCGDRDLTRRVANLLQDYGFQVRIGSNANREETEQGQTEIRDRGKMPTAGQRVRSSLALSTTVLSDPIRYVSSVEIIVGSDLAANAFLPEETTFRRRHRARHVLRPRIIAKPKADEEDTHGEEMSDEELAELIASLEAETSEMMPGDADAPDMPEPDQPGMPEGDAPPDGEPAPPDTPPSDDGSDAD